LHPYKLARRDVFLHFEVELYRFFDPFYELVYALCLSMTLREGGDGRDIPSVFVPLDEDGKLGLHLLNVLR